MVRMYIETKKLLLDVEVLFRDFLMNEEMMFKLIYESMINHSTIVSFKPGCVVQLVWHLTRKSGVLGSIPGLATYFRFSLP